MPHVRILGTVAAVAALLAGCGGDTGSSGVTLVSITAEDLETISGNRCAMKGHATNTGNARARVRLRYEPHQQTERHDGGGYWIGTGGRSPFGTGGYHPTGMSLRTGQMSAPGGGRSILRTADARRYRGYRNDLILDVRQLEVALRKLQTSVIQRFE
jgi:uncharacterized protein with von Willebrand factor type A (vWA) domain